MRLSGSFLCTQQLLRDAPASLSRRAGPSSASRRPSSSTTASSRANRTRTMTNSRCRATAARPAAAPPFAARRCSHGSLSGLLARACEPLYIGVGHGSCCLSLPLSLCRSRRPASSSPPRLRKHPRSSRTLYSSAIRCSTIQCSRPSRTPPSCGTSRRRSSSARGSSYASWALI